MDLSCFEFDSNNSSELTNDLMIGESLNEVGEQDACVVKKTDGKISNNNLPSGEGDKGKSEASPIGDLIPTNKTQVDRTWDDNVFFVDNEIEPIAEITEVNEELIDTDLDPNMWMNLGGSWEAKSDEISTETISEFYEDSLIGIGYIPLGDDADYDANDQLEDEQMESQWNYYEYLHEEVDVPYQSQTPTVDISEISQVEASNTSEIPESIMIPEPQEISFPRHNLLLDDIFGVVDDDDNNEDYESSTDTENTCISVRDRSYKESAHLSEADSTHFDFEDFSGSETEELLSMKDIYQDNGGGRRLRATKDQDSSTDGDSEIDERSSLIQGKCPSGLFEGPNSTKVPLIGPPLTGWGTDIGRRTRTWTFSGNPGLFSKFRSYKSECKVDVMDKTNEETRFLGSKFQRIRNLFRPIWDFFKRSK